MKTIALKYCGGCNPFFDREAFVDRLLKEFPALAPVPLDTNEPWFVLVVCGCRRACAEYKQLCGREGKMVICDDSEYKKLCEFIRGAL